MASAKSCGGGVCGGGVYVPPSRKTKATEEDEQRTTWDALRKSITGLVNKVNSTNIKNVIHEMFAEDLIRGRGLFCRSCIKSQMACPEFTDVFAALVAVVNSRVPEVGLILLRRVVVQFLRAYERNDKPQLLAAVKFIAHLANQRVVDEMIAIEVLITLLLENRPITDDRVEVAVAFVTECGSLLLEVCPRGLHGVFEGFRDILHKGVIDRRVRFLIEDVFMLRWGKFPGHPAIREELDLVEEGDRWTHEVSLNDDEVDLQFDLDVFKHDPNFIENEKRYEQIKNQILPSEAGEEEESDDGEPESEAEQMEVKDETETNLINLRRSIYQTIMSSVGFEEAGHKLMEIMRMEHGQEMELCIMLLECCGNVKSYVRYYGLLGQRFCTMNRVYRQNFEKCFVEHYSTVHRLETDKIRNVAKFFAHLLATDALPWQVLTYIRLTEEDTSSSSRIFIKYLFQELSEHLGLRSLNERLLSMQDSLKDSIFPKDSPKNTRFAINFFRCIGLGGITKNMRDYLKNILSLLAKQQKQKTISSSSSSESESDDDKCRNKKKRRRT